jgi:phosphatidylserine/phosphatidylglycerophosphate/cardiolipin synthase-like enzyme
LKSSPQAHAIIHDKIVVIDPMSATDCAVITGSHNDGYKASYANDENLLILCGNQRLALAYTTHIMDVYDHYRWRYMVQQQKQHAWTGLQTTPHWQDKYFQPGNMAYQELEYWFS